MFEFNTLTPEDDSRTVRQVYTHRVIFITDGGLLLLSIALDFLSIS